MHKLKAITPLGATVAATDTFPGISITEVTDRALASLSMRLGHEGKFTKRAKDALGLSLPNPNCVATGEAFTALWIGPDSWMIDASYQSHENLAGEIKASVQETASVVEQTDGWCRFDVSGDAVFSLFERLCNADVRAMQSGTVTRCSIHHVGCYLWCAASGQKFSVLGPRSTTGSLHHALLEAAQAISVAQRGANA